MWGRASPYNQAIPQLDGPIPLAQGIPPADRPAKTTRAGHMITERQQFKRRGGARFDRTGVETKRMIATRYSVTLADASEGVRIGPPAIDPALCESNRGRAFRCGD